MELGNALPGGAAYLSALWNVFSGSGKSGSAKSPMSAQLNASVRNLSPAFCSVMTEALWLSLWLAGKLVGKNEWTDAAQKLALGKHHVASRQKTVVLIEQYIHSDLPMICNRLEQSIAASTAGGQVIPADNCVADDSGSAG